MAKDNPIYELTREILNDHGYTDYQRHHFRGKEMRRVIGAWNDIIGIGVIPLDHVAHTKAHTQAGKRDPFEFLSGDEINELWEMMDEQISAIIARPELWPWIKGERK